jgi:hypothetical protein
MTFYRQKWPGHLAEHSNDTHMVTLFMFVPFRYRMINGKDSGNPTCLYHSHFCCGVYLVYYSAFGFMVENCHRHHWTRMLPILKSIPVAVGNMLSGSKHIGSRTNANQEWSLSSGGSHCSWLWKNGTNGTSTKSDAKKTPLLFFVEKLWIFVESQLT